MKAEWTSQTEGLPTPYVRVLVFAAEERMVEIAFVDAHGDFYYLDNTAVTDYPVAWHPLPKAPDGEPL